ncbi:MAG: hypothetical protein IKU24_05905 [Clostridia bacterium]|nr:hypothetical protein [Clostridia bacterium]
MKKLTEEGATKKICAYFASRKIEKRNQEGEILLGKGGEVLYDEKPYTVTGLALALGFSRREELLNIKNKKIKALIDRALLKIEENAEEKLFSKDTFHGAKLFLEANFDRWSEEGIEAQSADGLGVCTQWAE